MAKEERQNKTKKKSIVKQFALVAAIGLGIGYAQLDKIGDTMYSKDINDNINVTYTEDKLNLGNVFNTNTDPIFYNEMIVTFTGEIGSGNDRYVLIDSSDENSIKFSGYENQALEKIIIQKEDSYGNYDTIKTLRTQESNKSSIDSQHIAQMTQRYNNIREVIRDSIVGKYKTIEDKAKIN